MLNANCQLIFSIRIIQQTGCLVIIERGTWQPMRPRCEASWIKDTYSLLTWQTCGRGQQNHPSKEVMKYLNDHLHNFFPCFGGEQELTSCLGQPRWPFRGHYRAAAVVMVSGRSRRIMESAKDQYWQTVSRNIPTGIFHLFAWPHAHNPNACI